MSSCRVVVSVANEGVELSSKLVPLDRSKDAMLLVIYYTSGSAY